MINTIIELRLWLIDHQTKYSKMEALEKHRHEQIVKAVCGVVIFALIAVHYIVKSLIVL